MRILRIPIREQLALLILLASLIGLAVVSVATWLVNRSFVLSVVKTRLTLVASLKAGQLSANLNLMQTTVNLVTTRVLLQGALQNYNQDGNLSASNWAQAGADFRDIITSEGSLGQYLLAQAILWPKNASGPAGNSSLLKVTIPQSEGPVELPVLCKNGRHAILGMDPSECGGESLGYPPWLYPNFTYASANVDGKTVQQAAYEGDVIGPGAKPGLLLGPWMINSTYALASFTLPVINNTSSVDVLGWLTVLMNAELIQSVLTSSEGLEETGETLLIGPANKDNLFQKGILYDSNQGKPPDDFMVRYVVPLQATDAHRHPQHFYGSQNLPFAASEYPAVESALTQATGRVNNVGAVVHGHNEAGKKVASGYAIASFSLADWLVVVEQTQGEVWGPIVRLRNTIIACVFGTAGFMVIIAWPLAHFSVLPIRRLSEATRRSVEPAQEPSRSSLGSSDSPHGHDHPADVGFANGGAEAEKTASGKDQPKNAVDKWREKRHQEREFRREQRRKRAFRIPGKVPDRKHIVVDELSDLTKTFNEMSDELMIQWSRLEERVQQRTAELELSKKAAEAANESKTLFIANISHELKTPLNGIMGMCAVCMQDDDFVRVKRSLGTIYKSGDLLLNLLTDLLTFSKNQVGQQLTLDEKEFRLRDVNSQILAVFDKQATEGKIDLRVVWEGVPFQVHDDAPPEMTDYGPMGTGRVKDMILWGDIQRILQVVINLVSNALKFTPSGGSVVLTIRCLPDLVDGSRRTSLASRQSPSRQSRQSRQSYQPSSRFYGSESSQVGTRMATANAINARDRPHAIISSERTASPPPGIGLTFDFEVRDTGPGIPGNLQGKIFEPFVQGDLRLTKKYGGTGLGLSICSQLASLMQGSIKVESTVGVGSTFTMTIPLRHLQSRADSTASSRGKRHKDASSQASSIDEREGVRAGRILGDEAGSDAHAHASATGSPRIPNVRRDSQPRLVGLRQPFFAAPDPMEASPTDAMKKMADATRSERKIRVLVAEDNHINQEVVLRMLKLEDIYDVTVAKDGQEALDAVKESMAPPDPESPSRSGPFDLIFMDVQMPNVDGLQSTRLIREIGYQAPIVALTAFAEESNIRDCMDSGMNFFLSKPIKRPQLKKVLKDYCPPIPEENEDPLLVPEPKLSSAKRTTSNVAKDGSSESGSGRAAGASNVSSEGPRHALQAKSANGAAKEVLGESTTRSNMSDPNPTSGMEREMEGPPSPVSPMLDEI